MNDRALSELRDLARRDDALADHAAELRRRDEDAGEIRARAEAIDSFFTAYPEQGRSGATRLAAGHSMSASRAVGGLDVVV